MPHIYVDCDIGLESAWVYQLTLVMGCFVIQINESFPYIERNNFVKFAYFDSTYIETISDNSCKFILYFIVIILY